MFLLVLSMAPLIVKGETIKLILFQSMFKDIYIGFKVDAFGEIFAITASSLWILGLHLLNRIHAKTQGACSDEILLLILLRHNGGSGGCAISKFSYHVHFF